MTNLIASSGSKEGLTKMINQFYYSTNWFINDEWQAENSKTGKKTGKIVIKKRRFRFEL